MQLTISNAFHSLKDYKLFWYELLFIWFKCYELELRNYGTCVLYMVRTIQRRLCLGAAILAGYAMKRHAFGIFVFEFAT